MKEKILALHCVILLLSEIGIKKENRQGYSVHKLIKNIVFKSLIGSFLLFLCILSANWYSGNESAVSNNDIAVEFMKIPLSFEKNEGQTDTTVKYLNRGHGYTLYFTPDEIVMTIQSGSHHNMISALKMQFVGSNPDKVLRAIEEQACKSNYFFGNDPAKWHTEVSNYEKVAYQNLYPGIDALFYGNPQQLEYDICVAPHANPNNVRLAFDGSKDLFIDERGDLRIVTEQDNEILMSKPFVYQVKGDSKIPVNGHFVLLAYNEVGFAVDNYDTNALLVIDPLLSLDFSTYLGGSGNDIPNRVALDSSGNIYVTGGTSSANFPTMNPFQPSFAGGGSDAFVTKFNPSGSALIYSTYLGGSGSDVGIGIVVDSSGSAYIGGNTNSLDFPTVNPFQASLAGANDIFVAKFNPAGSALIYSTYLGGSSNEFGGTLALDSSLNLYVAGSTNSLDFPTVNPFQGVYGGGGFDGFLTKFNPEGSALVFSTYLGGSGTDTINAMALDSSGSAYVAGSTDSTNFPTKKPFQASLVGALNAFLTKFDPDGSALVYSTYIGGSGLDFDFAMAVDNSGHAYLTGTTTSPDFPTLNAIQPTLLGSSDAFVTKFAASGSSLIYSTYLGGSNSDYATGIAADSLGNAYVVGATTSTDFPTLNAIQTTLAGTRNAFVTELNPTGTAFVYSTYLGGSGLDEAKNLTINSTGSVYVIGDTNSVNFPTKNAFQPLLAGGLDGFLAKLTFLSSPSDFKAVSVCNQFLTQIDIVNVLTWKPAQGAVEYRIYRDASLTDLIATIPATNRKLQFKDYNRKKNLTYTYFIVAVGEDGRVSPVASTQVKATCKKSCQKG